MERIKHLLIHLFLAFIFVGTLFEMMRQDPVMGFGIIIAILICTFLWASWHDRRLRSTFLRYVWAQLLQISPSAWKGIGLGLLLTLLIALLLT